MSAQAQPAIATILFTDLVGSTELIARWQRAVERGPELAWLVGDEAAYQRELREAHRLFTAMGATLPAERVAKELRA